MSAPQLRTLRINNPDGTHGHAAWCPWCETVHHHGQGGGHRAAHCADGTGSPLAATGYGLDVAGTGTNAEEAAPAALLLDAPPLANRLNDHAVDLRNRLAAALLGMDGGTRLRDVCFDGTHVATANGAIWWVRTAEGKRVRDGYDLVSLAELLHGLPAGVISVRILEAVTGLRLDARTALDVQAAIDRWVERGAPPDQNRRPR